MTRRAIWPRNKPLPAFSSYAQEVAFLNGHDFTAALTEGDWESGPPPRLSDRRMHTFPNRRHVADAERAARGYGSRGGESRATSSPIGRITIPVDTTTPRRAKNELRVPWILELTLLKGFVTCVHMVVTAGPFGKLGMIRGGAHDFFISSLDEQIAGIEQEGRGAGGRAAVRITLTTGRLGFRCGYEKIRQGYVVPRNTYVALLRLFREARKRLHKAVTGSVAERVLRLPAASPQPRRRRPCESRGRKGGG